ncbi:MAG: L-seryl-tRNA(Ser) seleniumtransferase [Halioglobus sp.]|jgi:L-seryl-tRNA(Ser) seleniumtransferase
MNSSDQAGIGQPSNVDESGDNPYRQLPSVDALLQDMPDEVGQWGRDAVTQSLRDILTQMRQSITQKEGADTSAKEIIRLVNTKLRASSSATLIPVINLTGTVLHTNLGRAILPKEALDAIVTVAGSASNLEFDLREGVRGDRESHVESLICELTGAEAATAVNNNAAAVLLVLNTLALNREVPVSRGELVEIGGSFRIPEVMQRSGCTLVEIGATNRTHLKDYRNAISSNTALLMKVHTSNYQVEGFTHSVEEIELASLAHDNDLPLVIDLGSGNLVDFGALGLPPEPTAASSIANGADIITFSGDKLLGGPQAGIIAGSAQLIAQIKQNPLKRALRLDKMTLAGLAEILKLYRDPDTVLQRLPTLRLLTRPAEDIAAQAKLILPAVQEALGADFSVAVAACHSQIGSGSLPVETLSSSALTITPFSSDDAQLRRLAAALRESAVPVIGRLHKNALWLDLRCLEQHQQQVFIEQLQTLKL